MRDLFDIFPDLPWVRHPSLFGRAHNVETVRRRAANARARMTVAVGHRRRVADAVRNAYLQRGAPGRRRLK